MSTESAPPWRVGMQQFREHQRAAELVGVLRGAHRAGLLEHLATPKRAADLSADLGVSLLRLDAVLRLLEAHGIVCVMDGRWALSVSWAAFIAGPSPQRFGALLDFGRVQVEEFERCLNGAQDYWHLDDVDCLAVAAAVSPDPTSALTLGMVRVDLQALPEVVAALDQGGRILELGCGLGSRLCAFLQAFPTARAVGVELISSIVEEGRRRAEALGIGDRLAYVVGDASGHEPDGLFDLVSWSQVFFPEATRAGALATARRALKPGGWVRGPVLWDSSDPPQLGSAEDQDSAADRLLCAIWGVPPRTTIEVGRELEEAGFVDVQVDHVTAGVFIRGRQPST